MDELASIDYGRDSLSTKADIIDVRVVDLFVIHLKSTAHLLLRKVKYQS